MRRIDFLREQNVLIFDGLLKTALAEAEARAGELDRALGILDEALTTREPTGYRTFDAELIASAAKCCRSAIPLIRRPRRKRS